MENLENNRNYRQQLSENILKICKETWDVIKKGDGFNLEEADRVLSTLNTLSNDLLKIGGILPPFLLEVIRTNEKLRELLGVKGNHQYLKLRGAGKLKNPISLNQEVRVVGYICLTLLTTFRNIFGCEMNIKRTDAIHFITIGGEKEFGWQHTGRSIDEIRKKISRERRDYVQNSEMLHEVMKGIKRMDSKLIESEFLKDKNIDTLDFIKNLGDGGLTLTNSIGREAIRKGERPHFGTFRPLVLESTPKEIAISVLVHTERENIRAIIDKEITGILRGGRFGLRPYELFNMESEILATLPT